MKKLVECPKSPTGKHEWEEVKERRDLKFGNRPVYDWGTIPGAYCIHCGKRKEEKK